MLSHNQGGYYNSLILQAMELPPKARVENERKIQSDAQKTTQKIAAAVSDFKNFLFRI